MTDMHIPLEMTPDLIRDLLEAIQDSNKTQVQLVERYEFQQRQQLVMQEDINKFHGMIFQDGPGRWSVQTMLTKMDDRLKIIEMSHMCIRRCLIAIAVPISIAFLLWLSSNFFDIVVHNKVIAPLVPSKIDMTQPKVP